MVRQVQNKFQRMLSIGESKHAAKADGTLQDGIFSWGTYRTYQKHCCYFARWAKSEHGCKTIESAREYVPEWIQHRIDIGLSPYTVKMEVSALAKEPGCLPHPTFGRLTPFASDRPQCFPKR